MFLISPKFVFLVKATLSAQQLMDSIQWNSSPYWSNTSTLNGNINGIFLQPDPINNNAQYVFNVSTYYNPTYVSYALKFTCSLGFGDDISEELITGSSVTPTGIYVVASGSSSLVKGYISGYTSSNYITINQNTYYDMDLKIIWDASGVTTENFTFYDYLCLDSPYYKIASLSYSFTTETFSGSISDYIWNAITVQKSKVYSSAIPISNISLGINNDLKLIRNLSEYPLQTGLFGYIQRDVGFNAQQLISSTPINSITTFQNITTWNTTMFNATFLSGTSQVYAFELDFYFNISYLSQTSPYYQNGLNFTFVDSTATFGMIAYTNPTSQSTYYFSLMFNSLGTTTLDSGLSLKYNEPYECYYIFLYNNTQNTVTQFDDVLDVAFIAYQYQDFYVTTLVPFNQITDELNFTIAGQTFNYYNFSVDTYAYLNNLPYMYFDICIPYNYTFNPNYTDYWFIPNSGFISGADIYRYDFWQNTLEFYTGSIYLNNTQAGNGYFSISYTDSYTNPNDIFASQNSFRFDHYDNSSNLISNGILYFVFSATSGFMALKLYFQISVDVGNPSNPNVVNEMFNYYLFLGFLNSTQITQPSIPTSEAIVISPDFMMIFFLIFIPFVICILFFYKWLKWNSALMGLFVSTIVAFISLPVYDLWIIVILACLIVFWIYRELGKHNITIRQVRE